MRIKYRKIPDDTRAGGYSFYPFLRIALKSGVNMCTTSALVDSGSLDSIFPESLGQVLGLDIPSGEPHTFHGFNHEDTSGYVHKVKMQVEGFSHWIDLDVAVIQSEKVIPVIGQNGFFENYQVIFERFQRTFEIIPKIEAIMRNKRGYGRGR